MPIKFDCSCGKELRVAEAYAGKRAKCPACGVVVTVPSAPVPEPELEPVPVSEPQQTLSAEDEAFRALSEGPDPVPSSRNRDWQAPEPPGTSAPRIPERPPAPYSAGPVPQRGHIPKPKPSKVHDPYEAPEHKWQVDWGQIGGGILGVLIGGGLLIGGLAAGRFFIWSPIILIGGIIGIINGLLNKS